MFWMCLPENGPWGTPLHPTISGCLQFHRRSRKSISTVLLCQAALPSSQSAKTQTSLGTFRGPGMCSELCTHRHTWFSQYPVVVTKKWLERSLRGPLLCPDPPGCGVRTGCLSVGGDNKGTHCLALAQETNEVTDWLA